MNLKLKLLLLENLLSIDELIEKYTQKAKTILENTFSVPYDDIKKALDENREAFLNELNNL